MLYDYGIIGKPETAKRVLLIPGNTYIIKPSNPRAKKNVDRKILLRDFCKSTDGKKVMAKVTYLDNNRPGKIELTGINEIDEVE